MTPEEQAADQEKCRSAMPDWFCDIAKGSYPCVISNRGPVLVDAGMTEKLR